MSQISVDIQQHKLPCNSPALALNLISAENMLRPRARGDINSINVFDQIETEAQHVCCWEDGNFLLSIFMTDNYI